MCPILQGLASGSLAVTVDTNLVSCNVLVVLERASWGCGSRNSFKLVVACLKTYLMIFCTKQPQHLGRSALRQLKFPAEYLSGTCMLS